MNLLDRTLRQIFPLGNIWLHLKQCVAFIIDRIRRFSKWKQIILNHLEASSRCYSISYGNSFPAESQGVVVFIRETVKRREEEGTKKKNKKNCSTFNMSFGQWPHVEWRHLIRWEVLFSGRFGIVRWDEYAWTVENKPYGTFWNRHCTSNDIAVLTPKRNFLQLIFDYSMIRYCSSRFDDTTISQVNEIGTVECTANRTIFVLFFFDRSSQWLKLYRNQLFGFINQNYQSLFNGILSWNDFYCCCLICACAVLLNRSRSRRESRLIHFDFFLCPFVSKLEGIARWMMKFQSDKSHFHWAIIKYSVAHSETDEKIMQ